MAIDKLTLSRLRKLAKEAIKRDCSFMQDAVIRELVLSIPMLTNQIAEAQMLAERAISEAYFRLKAESAMDKPQ